jgi:hypothetical protein
MRVITVDQIKTQLGIAAVDTTYDAELTALLPELDARVKAITRRRWIDRVAVDTTVDKTEATLKPLDIATVQLPRNDSRNVANLHSVETFGESLTVGQQIAATGIATGTHIADVYDEDYEVLNRVYEEYVRIELSAAATATGSAVATLGISIAYHPVIARLAWWMLGQRSTTARLDSGITSRSMGPVSVSYGDSQLDGKHGVPRWAIAGLPRYGRGR